MKQEQERYNKAQRKSTSPAVLFGTPSENYKPDLAIYTMAHDIKSPLNQVAGLLDIACRLNQDDEVAGLLAMALQANSNLARRVHEMLQMNTPDESKTEVDPEKLIMDIWMSLSKSYEVDDITFFLRNRIGDGIRTDLVRLKSILQNLLENAIKYGHREGGDSSILVTIYKHRDRMVIKVMDNGQGLTTEQQRKIFDRRYQVNTEAEGHGLGLHLSRQNARQTGGDLTVSSQPGKGTTFTLRIPCLE